MLWMWHVGRQDVIAKTLQCRSDRWGKISPFSWVLFEWQLRPRRDTQILINHLECAPCQGAGETTFSKRPGSPISLPKCLLESPSVPTVPGHTHRLQAGDSRCPSQQPDCMSIQFRFPSIHFITNRIKILLKTGEHKLIKMTSDKKGEIQLISVTFSPQVWFAGQIAIDVQDTLC